MNSRVGNRPTIAELKNLNQGTAEEPAPAPPPAAGDELSEQQLREIAEGLGFRLAPRHIKHSVRPAAVNGRVRMSARIDLDVRRTMERLRPDLGLSYDDIINAALREYFLNQGYQVESRD